MLVVLAYIGYLILSINVILFTKGFSFQRKAFSIFNLYLVVTLVIQVFSEAFIFLRINNLFLSHFYFILQFIILSFFYLTILKTNFQKSIVKVGLVLGLLALGIQYDLNPSLFFKFNLFEVFITSFLIIIYATFHLYNLLGEKKEFYYINIGILMYLFSSTILFLVGNLMTYLSTEVNKIPWILNAFLYLIYQLLILLEWKRSFQK